ncbi:MAG: RHS repeat-associated core domain-containing protein [Candidatus Electrothrix scaldis]|nr:MAG: RHS repeat-associated core domain-containing protein [Candidatus Electrothrix sp. GW3-3]
MTKGGVTVGAYQYDGRGLRTVKTVNGEDTLFVYCKSGKLIAEADSDGNILKEYVYLDGDIFAHFQYEVPVAPLEAASSVASSQEVIPEPVAEQQETASPVVAAASVPSDTAFLQSIYLLLLLNHKSAEGAYYYINDHLGTPQVITNDAGSVVWQAEYLPFGKVNISVADIENNLRFPGQYYDAETELHYNWNRYYDPEAGRYIAADPIGLDGGMNLYAYVDGDPVNWLDPDALAKGKNKGGAGLQYKNKDKKKGSEDRQKSGDRERNVAHPESEEHSRVPKGGYRYESDEPLCGRTCQKTIVVTGVTVVVVCCTLQPEICLALAAGGIGGGSLAFQ